MTTAEWITDSLVFIIAAILAVVSIRNFQNKGFLFDNAYIYASKEERGKMDQKPYYRQSAIVFCILCAVFLVFGSADTLEYLNYSEKVSPYDVYVREENETQEK